MPREAQVLKALPEQLDQKVILVALEKRDAKEMTDRKAHRVTKVQKVT